MIFEYWIRILEGFLKDNVKLKTAENSALPSII